MLRNTFVHLPGIGPRRERALWDRGCVDWNGFLAAAEAGQSGSRALESAAPLVRQSVEALHCGDAAFFGARLPSRETWRLYRNFAEQAVFLDIETTGLSAWSDHVTVIGAFARGRPALFIQGINLDQFPAYIAQYPLLVSYNGSQFDVPFLRAHFPNARLDQPHIDLRFVLKSLGYRGGLKAVERALGIRRDAAVEGVDGFEAVRLWYRYRRGDRNALLRLAHYNLTDVLNLLELVELAVSHKMRGADYPCQDAPAARDSAVQWGADYVQTWLADHLNGY